MKEDCFIIKFLIFVDKYKIFEINELDFLVVMFIKCKLILFKFRVFIRRIIIRIKIFFLIFIRYNLCLEGE